MLINGKYYSEPEVQAYISKLQTELGSAEDYIDSRNERIAELETAIKRYESENRKLTEENEELRGLYNDASLGIGYLEQRCEELEAREKEYKRLLKEAVDIVHDYACGFCPCCKNYDKDTDRCLVDVYDCQHNDKWEWFYEAEALDLIGEEEET